MLEMSYPCPYTGNTTIKSIWTCSNCSRWAGVKSLNKILFFYEKQKFKTNQALAFQYESWKGINKILHSNSSKSPHGFIEFEYVQNAIAYYTRQYGKEWLCSYTVPSKPKKEKKTFSGSRTSYILKCKYWRNIMYMKCWMIYIHILYVLYHYIMSAKNEVFFYVLRNITGIVNDDFFVRKKLGNCTQRNEQKVNLAWNLKMLKTDPKKVQSPKCLLVHLGTMT